MDTIKNRSLIFAIDFDGTIVDHKFPEIGHLKPGAIRVMRRLQAAGHKIILWTCRADDTFLYLTYAVDFLDRASFVPDAVNKNIDQETKLGIPKILADFYLDDMSFPPFMGWLDFESCMEEMGIL